MSMSFLCRSSSSIPSRVADVIPLIFSVATLYTWVMYGGYGCHYVGVIISVALPGAFCFVFVHDVSAILFLFVVICSFSGFPSVLVTVFRHQWGRVVSPPGQFGLHACGCVVRVSPYDVAILPFVWYFVGRISCAWILMCVTSSFIIGWFVVSTNMASEYLLLCSVVLLSPGVKFTSAMLDCSCVHRDCDFFPWLEVCLLSFVSPLGRYLVGFLLSIVALLVVYFLYFAWLRHPTYR